MRYPYDEPIRAPMPLWVKQGIVIVLLLTTRWIGKHAIEASQPIGKSASFALPDQIGSWTGRSIEVDHSVFEILQPDAMVQKVYALKVSRAAAPRPEVGVTLIYSRDWKAIHSPVACLMATGWTVGKQGKRTISKGYEELTVNLLQGEKRGQKTNLAYYFAQNQEAVAGWIPALAKLVGARIMHRPAGAAQIQFVYDPSLLENHDQPNAELADLILGVAHEVNAAMPGVNAN